MKLCLSFLIVALFASLAEARLGDSSSGLLKRYGLPSSEPKVDPNYPDTTVFSFTVGEYFLECTTINGITESACYWSYDAFDSKEISVILSLNRAVRWKIQENNKSIKTGGVLFVSDAGDTAESYYYSMLGILSFHIDIRSAKYAQLMERRWREEEKIREQNQKIERQKRLEEERRRLQELGL